MYFKLVVVETSGIGGFKDTPLPDCPIESLRTCKKLVDIIIASCTAQHAGIPRI